MILDLIVIGLIILSFIISAKKGLVKSIWKITALVVTIVLVTALRMPAVEYIAGTNISDTVYDFISEKLTLESENPIESVQNTEEDEAKSVIPEFLLEELQKSSDADRLAQSINRGTDAVTRRLTLYALNIIVTAGLFIIIRVLLMAAFTIINTIVKLPLINQANALLGGLLGAVNMLAIIYIACAFIPLFAEGEIAGLINESILVKYFYNYNILLRFMMKI